MPVSSGSGASGSRKPDVTIPPDMKRALNIVDAILSGEASAEAHRWAQERAEHEDVIRRRGHSDGLLQALAEAQRARDKATEVLRQAHTEANALRSTAEQEINQQRTQLSTDADFTRREHSERETALRAAEARCAARENAVAEREAAINAEYEKAHRIEAEARELASRSRAYADRIRAAMESW